MQPVIYQVYWDKISHLIVINNPDSARETLQITPIEAAMLIEKLAVILQNQNSDKDKEQPHEIY